MERTASASIAAAPAVITAASPSGWASPSERPARRKENNRGEQLVAAGRRTARRAGPGSLNYLRRGRRKIRPRQRVVLGAAGNGFRSHGIKSRF
jgi:hypothetical protein